MERTEKCARGIHDAVAIHLATALLLTACAAAPDSTRRRVAFDPTYPDWSQVLARSATPQGFRYDFVLEEPSALDRQIEAFGTVTGKEFQRFSREKRLVFLINAHNAHAVARIARKYPVKSIEKTRLLGSALKKRDIRLIGRKWSLASLRDEIMGPNYRDSRAIFTLNWGCRGCAPLPPIALTETNLEAMLERRTRDFIRTKDVNHYERREKKFYLSALIKEYRDDLNRDFANLWKFIEHYTYPEDLPEMEIHPPKLKFQKFDGTLNDASAY